MNDSSILSTIKSLLGTPTEYTKFDNEIVVHINSVFMTLAQLGVGPAKPFQITGSEETWSDYLGDDVDKYAGIKSYIYFKVKLMWDAPQSAALIESMNKTINEFEWRLNVQAETPGDGDTSMEASL